MTKSTTPPKWAQWAAGLALIAVALTAGGLSLGMNIAAGLAIGITVAIAFGLSDVAKLLIPIICQAIGWDRHLKAVYAVASLVSIACASLYLADQFGEAIAAKENRAAITANTDQQIADLRASLTMAREMAASEAQRGGCGPKCESLNARVSELETTVSSVLRQRQSVKAADVADGKAVVIAGVLGTDEAATSRGTAFALIFAALVIGELCAHLTHAAAAMIGAAWRAREPQGQPVAKHSLAVIKLTAEAIGTAPKRGTRAYYLQRLQRDFPAIAARVATDKLSVYKASIEAGLRKAPKKSAKWTKPEAYMKTTMVSA